MAWLVFAGVVLFVLSPSFVDVIVVGSVICLRRCCVCGGVYSHRACLAGSIITSDDLVLVVKCCC